MSNYGKLHRGLWEGTLGAHWEAWTTFAFLLAHAAPDGVVDIHPSAISRFSSLPLEVVERGLAVLTAPDPESRTPGEDGARLVLLDAHRPWGWRIVNYDRYRFDSPAERVRSWRERNPEAVQEYNERRRAERGVTRRNTALRGVTRRNVALRGVTRRNEEVEVDSESKIQSEAKIEAKTESSELLPARDLGRPVEPLSLGELAGIVCERIVVIGGSEVNVYDHELPAWERAYPAVDVRQELKRICAWCQSNPANRKTARGLRRFINSWLARVQDRARPGPLNSGPRGGVDARYGQNNPEINRGG